MLYYQLKNENTKVSILEIDMLTLATELAMCIGWSWVDGEQTFSAETRVNETHKIPDGSIDENYVIRLTLTGFLFQVSFRESKINIFRRLLRLKLVIPTTMLT